jgi:ferredoxin
MEISHYSTGIILFFSLALTSVLTAAAVISLAEGEKRAMLRLIIIAVVNASVGALAAMANYPGKVIVAAVICLSVLAFLFLLFRRPLRYHKPLPELRGRAIDEHDTIFARMRFIPGTPVWEEYYATHPDEAKADTAARELPGLLSHESRFFHQLNFAAAETGFDMIRYLHSALTHPLSDTPPDISASYLTRYIKGWATYLGVHTTGITRLREYHLYTRRGRGADIGKEVVMRHSHAIAFTVTMDRGNISSAPQSPVVFESSDKYLKAANIALLIASFLKNLGYDARAHIDGDYEVICPLVARDAGLGEIGRMGLLMTPVHGPRVRIAVVTASAPLMTDEVQRTPSVEGFCSICRKCADCCPAGAIPTGDMTDRGGVPGWKIDADACYRYWCLSGTDCGRCISVCPYSHPDNILHNTVRHLIIRSHAVARLALHADDFFYGRHPAPQPHPLWMDPR